MLDNPLIRELWWAIQYCPRCGSRWSAWHLFEQATGLVWRRVYALNPGRLSVEETVQLVALKRQFAGVAGEDH